LQAKQYDVHNAVTKAANNIVYSLFTLKLFAPRDVRC